MWEFYPNKSLKANRLAEREGFEPSIPCGIHAFQACALDHYATSPWWYYIRTVSQNKAYNQEFETKVLCINPVDIIEALRKLGAEETPEVLMRRYVFDLFTEDIEWLRLRDDGEKVTLTYKHKFKGNTEIGKTEEIEVEVADFDKTAQILKKVPFKHVYYQENKRHLFKIDGIEFSIDCWPKIDPYLEVESSSKEKIAEGLKVLGLEGKDAGDKDIVEIYKEAGENLHSVDELKFDNIKQ